MNSNEITVTQGRLNQALSTAIKKTDVGTHINQQIQDAVENVMIRTGIITKFYPFLDKAEVKLDFDDSLILCKILHRYGGDILDFYTPLESEKIFDDELKEPAIIPRSPQNVCVLRIHDNDSEENLILGYYQNEEIVEYNPAAPGNIKLMSLNEVNPYWIKFGIDGLEFRLPKSLNMEVGDLEENMKDFNYANSDNTYTKDEVYTKEEVDELIKNAIEEALGDDENTNTG